MSIGSYQDFIATISNSLVFNLRSSDNDKPGRYVRVVLKKINGTFIIVLILNNNSQRQPASFILKDDPDSDNFGIFLQTKNGTQFPVNITTDNITGAKYLSVVPGTINPLRINPAAINQPGVVTQFVTFTAVIGSSPSIMTDEFGFLRIDGNFPVDKFGFESVIPSIYINTVENWRKILDFIINGGELRGLLQRVQTGLAFTIISGVVVGIIALPFIGAVIAGVIIFFFEFVVFLKSTAVTATVAVETVETTLTVFFLEQQTVVFLLVLVVDQLSSPL